MKQLTMRCMILIAMQHWRATLSQLTDHPRDSPILSESLSFSTWVLSRFSVPPCQSDALRNYIPTSLLQTSLICFARVSIVLARNSRQRNRICQTKLEVFQGKHSALLGSGSLYSFVKSKSAELTSCLISLTTYECKSTDSLSSFPSVHFAPSPSLVRDDKMWPMISYVLPFSNVDSNMVLPVEPFGAISVFMA